MAKRLGEFPTLGCEFDDGIGGVVFVFDTIDPDFAKRLGFHFADCLFFCLLADFKGLAQTMIML